MGTPPLKVGRSYKITNYVAGDDFSNVGGSNVTGAIFTASGAYPNNWTHFSQLAPYYNTTLNAALTDILTTIPEITSVNTAAARASSPNVLYTLSSSQIALNLASDMAAFYSHLFYVIGSTAYLVDMKLDNGTRTLTEFKYFSFAKYQYKAPIAQVAAGSYRRFSAYAYGSGMSVNLFHDTEANANAALDDILTLENAARVNFSLPMIAGNFPKLGEKITLPDTSNVSNLSSWVRARKLRYDFLNDEINVEGEGAISAA
jgi:hypothetical protein